MRSRKTPSHRSASRPPMLYRAAACQASIALIVGVYAVLLERAALIVA